MMAKIWIITINIKVFGHCWHHMDFEEISFQFSKAIIQISKEVFHNADKSVIFWQHICFTFILNFHINESINQHHVGIILLSFVIPAFGYTRLAKIKKYSVKIDCMDLILISSVDAALWWYIIGCSSSLSNVQYRPHGL